MAEFCLSCFNKMCDENLTSDDVVLDDDLCEGCGTWKPCVVVVKKKSPLEKELSKLIKSIRAKIKRK